MPRTVATEEDWLREGLRRFSVGGPEALSVEGMSRALSCSKSSFYWHFGDRDAFVQRMLSYWSELGTTRVIAQLDALASPAARFRALVREAFSDRKGADFLFHLRRLARSDAHAAALLARTESGRIAYIAELLARSGADEADSAEIAEFVYGYYLGWYERHKHRPASDEALDAVLERLVRRLRLPSSLLGGCGDPPPPDGAPHG